MASTSFGRICTLVAKEALRFRANWGLLVMVGAVLALSGLVSLSARFGQLPGQEARMVSNCYVVYDPSNPAAAAWAEHLRSHLPTATFTRHHALKPIQFQPLPVSQFDQLNDTLERDALALELAPKPLSRDGKWQGGTVTYHYAADMVANVNGYRIWFLRETQRWINPAFALEEYFSRTRESQTREGEAEDRVPVIVTALVIFSFYLLSFNLYLTSTGEEREKRNLLAILLSPATAEEVVAAKVFFYAVTSLLVSMCVVAMYRPWLLLQPLLWSTVFVGSIAYVSIGTVFLCMIRRFTTINTISMMYLLGMAIVMFLARFLRVFDVMAMMMMETYLFRQLQEIIGEKANVNVLLDQVILVCITMIWVVTAQFVFSRRGVALASAR